MRIKKKIEEIERGERREEEPSYVKNPLTK